MDTGVGIGGGCLEFPLRSQPMRPGKGRHEQDVDASGKAFVLRTGRAGDRSLERCVTPVAPGQQITVSISQTCLGSGAISIKKTHDRSGAGRQHDPHTARWER